MKRILGVFCAVAILVAPAVAAAGVSKKESEKIARKFARRWIYNGYADADSYSYSCVRASPRVGRCIVRFYLNDYYVCRIAVKVTEDSDYVYGDITADNC